MWRRTGLVLAMAALGLGTPELRGQPAPGAATAASDASLERAILNGYRRYNGTCSHCHGPDGVGGSFAPSLIEAPLPLARFEQVVRDGVVRGPAVMQGFADDPNVAPYIGDIHAYLAARAAGTIGRGRPAPGR